MVREARAKFQVVKLNRLHVVLAILAALALLVFPMGKVIPTGALLERQVRQGVRTLERDFSGMVEREARQVLEELARFHRGSPVDAQPHRRSDGTLFVTPELHGYVIDVDATWYRLLTAPEHVEVSPALKTIHASASINDFPMTAVDRANPHRQAVALLINVDWGEKELPAMLSIMKRQGVKVTFFVSGRFADRYPNLIQQAALDGHEIASHGYDLSRGPKAWAASGTLLSDMQRSVEAIERTTGRKVVYWAPHMSEVSPEILSTAHKLRLRTVLYSVDSIDWRDDATKDLILARVGKAKAGDFILLHPKPNTVAALEPMIGSIRAKGLSMMTVTEILSPEPHIRGSAEH